VKLINDKLEDLVRNQFIDNLEGKLRSQIYKQLYKSLFRRLVGQLQWQIYWQILVNLNTRVKQDVIE